ncbi:putative endonuclease [Pseudomonas phage Skulduggery]|uniref:Putative endonuclease n=1 Tax=Pseudomonas phage Skulduggery TaxID=2006671 RepID=A0A1Y0T0V1_9CAUD|nr:RecE-like recombination exonuclease [Pseudomonas phage Skulduggery]ARV77138.1 putative endonuclease [Pseudomonas phage Skulduggery]
MSMTILELVQGTEPWHEARLVHRTASEAPTMMGDNPKMKRNELLHMKATGTAKEVSDWVQKFLFDKGHANEAKARAILEEEQDCELFPVTGVLDGTNFLMSSDGLDIAHTWGFEHKDWNEELAKAVRNEDPPAYIYWQLEQQIMVSDVEFITLVVSDGTRERREMMDYFPVPGRREALIAGWAQFDKDLAAYVPPAPVAVVVAKKMDELPQLVIRLSGGVTASNLDAYKNGALKQIESINSVLVTDQDFADADAAVKFCQKAEDELKLVKVRALEETADIKLLFETIDELSDAVRTKRLTLSKLVEKQKKTLKENIRLAGEKAFADHITALNAEIGPRVCMPAIAIDIAGVMANKRALASIQDAVDTEVARAKIEADGIVAKIRVNLAALRELDAKYRSLFPDANDIVQKDAEDFANLLTLRTGQFDREAQEAEDERQRQADALKEQVLADERKRVEQEKLDRQQQDEAKAAEAAKPVEAVRVEEPIKETPVSRPAATTAAVVEPVTPAATTSAPVHVDSDEPGDIEVPAGVATVTEYETQASGKLPKNGRSVVAHLQSFTALVRAVADGEMPEELLSINVEAVREFIEDCGHVPTGFSLGSAK